MKKLIFTLVTMFSVYAASAQMNLIEGYINWDTAANNAMQGSFTVWLIEHDTVANTLTAIDSVQVSGYMPKYSFSNHAAGPYLTKAAANMGSVGAPYLLPSYHDSSFYWYSALTINHTGGVSAGNNIWMIQGVNPGGPGFIGGNIATGANKGTGAGVPGMMVALMNASNQMVKYTYTDINGDYTFNNIPVGNYTVFPESIGLLTIPATGVALTTAQPTKTGLHFKKTPTHVKLIPSGINDLPSADLFSMYPNPANANVVIRFTSGTTGNVTISIADVTGRQVMVTELDAKSTEQINLSHLQSGTYFIKMTTDRATHTEKLVVKH